MREETGGNLFPLSQALTTMNENTNKERQIGVSTAPADRQQKSSEDSDVTMFCPRCNRLFALQSGDGDDIAPVYQTNDLSVCPLCRAPLRKPEFYDFIGANKRAAAEAEAFGDKAKMRELTRQRDEAIRQRDFYAVELEKAKSALSALQQELADRKRRADRGKMKKTCVVCGKEFLATRRTKQTCSGACKTKKARREHKENAKNTVTLR